MPRTAHPAFAALALDIAPLDDGALLLIPAGEFRAADGRPAGLPGWNLTAELATRLIEARQARGTSIVIDWEHATLHRAKKGEEAPAAGWIEPEHLAWREGVGVVALRSFWTPRAAAQLEAKEYRYGSPVFGYDPKTGDVTGLHSFALTNDPGLDGIAVALAALSPDQPTTETPMDEDILEQLRWLLNLPTLATPEEVAAELQKAVERIKAAAPEMAAASFDLVGTVTRAATAGAEIAALSAKAAAPDPAQFVPIATHQAVAEQLAALQADTHGKAVEAAVRGALDDGRLLPAQEAWARDLGKTNLAALTQFLTTAQPIAALSGMQSGGQAPAAPAKGRGDAEDLATAALSYQAEQAGKGVSVTTARAVRHIEANRSK